MENHEVQSYINKICTQIKWKVYHPAIKRELENHVCDNVADLINQGKEEKEAVRLTLDAFGKPEIIGKQLDKVYKPEYNSSFIVMSCLGILIFFFLEYFALKENISDFFWNVKAVTGIMAGSVGAILLFIRAYIDNSKIHITLFYMYFLCCLLCVVLGNISFDDRIYVLNGLLLLFPVFWCEWIYRLKDKRKIGLLLAAIAFLIPIGISCYVQAYASMFILVCSGWIIVLYTTSIDYLNIGNKRIIYLFISAMSFSIIGYLISIKIKTFFINAGSFFVRNYIKETMLLGGNKSDLIANQKLESYPLALLITNYGFLVLIVYFLFFCYIISEIKKVYEKQYYFQGKLIAITILLELIIEFSFSVLLNLGVPLMKGISVPLLDFNFGIVIKIIQLGVIEYLNCFGNYVFNNDVLNHLFDIEDGKIIIYYK